tara:strand:+ start:1168 stop:1431 length:264 start_codon:yes stop_codon:yes gene_type:complete
MTKFRVKKHRQLLYADGSVRGEQGYIVDGDLASERPTLAEQGDALDPTERQAVPGPVDQSRMVVVVKKAAPKKKKAAKKKAAKKAKS